MKRIILPPALLLGLGALLALSQTTIPEGPDKELVLAKCKTCHDIGFVAR